MSAWGQSWGGAWGGTWGSLGAASTMHCVAFCLLHEFKSPLSYYADGTRGASSSLDETINEHLPVTLL